jgi:hypothetical protein
MGLDWTGLDWTGLDYLSSSRALTRAFKLEEERRRLTR